MKFKIKTLLSLGVISAIGIGSTLPINAMSQESFCKKSICKNKCYEEYLCVNINGREYSTSVTTMNRLVYDFFNNKNNLTNKVEKNKKSSDKNLNNSKQIINKQTPNNQIESKNTDFKNATEVKKNENNNNLYDKPVIEKNNFTSYQKEILNLVNNERTNRGLNPLKLNESLSNVATKKSQDMIDKNYFDHTSPTYGSPDSMISQFGITFNTMGENIAMGQSSPQEVMNSWMNSPGHRKNILNPNFTELGVGIAQKGSTLYWTQMFIGK